MMRRSLQEIKCLTLKSSQSSSQEGYRTAQLVTDLSQKEEKKELKFKRTIK
jgi:hypothetical protein